MTINTIIYSIHYIFFERQERSVIFETRAIFHWSINFKTRFFFWTSFIHFFLSDRKIAHASVTHPLDKGHLSRSFNPCKSIFIHDRCTFVHSVAECKPCPTHFYESPSPSLPPSVLSLSSVSPLDMLMHRPCFRHRISRVPPLVNPVHLR